MRCRFFCDSSWRVGVMGILTCSMVPTFPLCKYNKLILQSLRICRKKYYERGKPQPPVSTIFHNNDRLITPKPRLIQNSCIHVCVCHDINISGLDVCLLLSRQYRTVSFAYSGILAPHDGVDKKCLRLQDCRRDVESFKQECRYCRRQGASRAVQIACVNPF